MVGPVATVNIPGVELVKAGTWQSARGEVSITAADLADMVSESRDPQVDSAPLKLGHVDPRFDGEPALGWVRNLRLSSDGDTLIGDLTDVPASLADILGSAYPRRSVEVAWGLPRPDGTKRGAVLTGLALLGVTPPAVKGLADVYKAAASGEGIVTVAVFSDTSDLQPTDQRSQDPATQTTDQPEEPMAENDKAPEDTKPADDATEVKDEAAPETPEASAAQGEQEPATAEASAPQTVTLSQGQYEDLVKGAQAGAAALAALDAQRRDGIITSALSQGRLRPADSEAWRKALDRDEEGTVALLGTLPQIVPTAALGSAHAGIADPGEAAWDVFEKSLTGKDA